MIIDKNFIVTKYSLDEIDEVMEEKLASFVIELFGEENAKNIEVKAEYVEYQDDNMRCFKDELRGELWLSLDFPQYTYENKVYVEKTEGIGIILEYQELQPFYMDGKFESLNVFKWIQGMPIQKHKKIYGIDKDVIYNKFNEYMLDC